MTLTRISLSNPVAVAVGCILIAIFGFISLSSLPIQMTPDLETPIIQVSTTWRASAPNEIEAEILEPQEDVLRSIPGMQRMSAVANSGIGSITMEFDVGTDLERSLIEVLNALNQVPRYPVDANEPTIRVGGNRFDSIIAWYIVRTADGNTRPIASYQDFVEDEIVTRFDRIEGVSETGNFGGRQHEVRITFDPYKAANIGLDLTRIAPEFGANADVSAGLNEVGKRQYTLRFSGKYNIETLGDLILDWREGKPILLRDVATVDLVMKDVSSILHESGHAAIAVNVSPEPGVNVLEVIAKLKETVAELQANELQRAGLVIEAGYDDSIYINASISMVRNNLLLGVGLAIVVLWWFLRRFRATLIVALSIPLCLLVAFMVLGATGRTLNIVSLAGLAFAVGMVLDAAIVVLENIFRQREQGLRGDEASLKGTTQVWGALLASTATTVAIFMPVIFLENEVGQLFGDLALTISAGVVASMLVAVTVLPTAASNWIRREGIEDHHRSWWRWVTDHVMQFTNTPTKRWSWVGGLTVLPIALAIFLLPPADYLPEGKKNMLFGFVLTPPGMGMQTIEDEFLDEINRRLEPFLTGERQPQIDSYFLGAAQRWGTFFGAYALDPKEMDDLIPIVNREILNGFPDSFAFAGRDSVFPGSRGGRQINIDLSADDFEELLAAGRAGFGATMAALPEARIQPSPSLDLAEPELRFIPDDRKIAEVGWNRSNVATVVRAMGDGAFVGEYFDGRRRYDVVLRAEDWYSPEELSALPVATQSGEVVSINELANLQRTAGPSRIQRIDRQRTLSLQVTPPPTMPLEEALTIIEEQVAPAISANLPEGGAIRYRGTAEALSEALASLSSSFLLAVVILYLLISALFRSFSDSLLVILSIPMATVGGVISLRLMDFALMATGGQQMDLLTMIGFVILLGLVVNNAILLVYRARDAEREGMSRRDAVENAVRLRLRPILMSTMTSIFGMLPLMLMPGSGSELYRGLATVIVGGMLISAIFTLLLLPSLLRMGEDKVPETVGPEQSLPAQA